MDNTIIEKELDKIIRRNGYWSISYIYLLAFQAEFTSLSKFIVFCSNKEEEIWLHKGIDNDFLNNHLEGIRNDEFNEFENYLAVFLISHSLSIDEHNNVFNTIFQMAFGKSKAKKDDFKFIIYYDENISPANSKFKTYGDWDLLMNKNAQASKLDFIPIKWNNDVKELAYLFWKLQEAKVITIKNLGINLSKVFINRESKSIDNTMLNKYFSDFNNNNTSPPSNAIEIDKFIKAIKQFNKEV